MMFHLSMKQQDGFYIVINYSQFRMTEISLSDENIVFGAHAFVSFYTKMKESEKILYTT